MVIRSNIYSLKDKFHFVRFQIVLLLEIKEIHLTRAQIDAFTWIILEGWSTKTQAKIKALNILKGNSINNLGSDLIGLGLLVSQKRGVKVLSPEIKIYTDEKDFLKLGVVTAETLNTLKVGKNQS